MRERADVFGLLRALPGLRDAVELRVRAALDRELRFALGELLRAAREPLHFDLLVPVALLRVDRL